MGMLEIRRASAQLNSLGQFRMPELDNGSARAFAAQAEAAKTAAAAARAAGAATVEGISRRGQIVARTLGDLGKMAVELANRENERIATNKVLESENDRNLYMVGNGTPEHPGQFNIRKGKDGEWHAEEWLREIKKAAERRREKFTENLNGPQRRMYDEMVAKRDVAWNARILAHAAKMTLDSQIATATAALGEAKKNAIGDWDVLPVRDASIDAMYEAKEDEMEVRQVPESLRAAEMKALTEDYLVNFAEAKFTAWKNETFDNADPDAVAAAWDAKGKALGALDGMVIGNESVRKHLGSDKLDETRRELLTKKFNEARTAAIGRSYALWRENERKDLEDISIKSREARASGDLETVETALAKMSEKADLQKKGTRVHVAAVEEVTRLNAAADALARSQEWDAILNAAASGTEYMPPKGSRMEKFHKQMKASFDRQWQAYVAEGMLAEAAAVQEARKSNEAGLRAAMLVAAAVDPGGFSARLAEAAEKGHVTLDQYRRLRDEFRDVWTKEGMPQKGAALVDILKREFYPNASYDLNDRLAVNPKTGRFEYAKDPETKKPFAGEAVELPGYRFETIESTVNPFLMNDFTPLAPQKWTDRKSEALTSDEQLKMLDWAMELARHDGEWISTDPQTGAKLDKPRKLDATAEFQDACVRIKNVKRAESVQEMLQMRAEAMLSLRAGFAQADDAVTGAAAMREAVELKTRETLKSAKRKPFTPKKPSSAPSGTAEGGPADDSEEN